MKLLALFRQYYCNCCGYVWRCWGSATRCPSCGSGDIEEI